MPFFAFLFHQQQQHQMNLNWPSSPLVQIHTFIATSLGNSLSFTTFSWTNFTTQFSVLYVVVVGVVVEPAKRSYAFLQQQQQQKNKCCDVYARCSAGVCMCVSFFVVILSFFFFSSFQIRSGSDTTVMYSTYNGACNCVWCVCSCNA